MTKGNEISAKTGLAFIGCGVMAESMIAGLLRERIVAAKQIVASHPRRDRREELKKRYGIKVFADNGAAAKAFRGPHSVVLLCVKPQRMEAVLADLAGALLHQIVGRVI